jgi:glycosyltransferase involved in cell wall biosynthesis
MIEPVSPQRRLRIAVLGDLDGIHTQSWVSYFVLRGHEVHGISYGTPLRPPEGVTVHALRPSASGRGPTPPGAGRPPATSLAHRLPKWSQRLANLVRYRRAGLRKTVEEVQPDVLHGHYLVEHGFYGTSARFHPYVVSAWGSDVLVDPTRSRMDKAIARFVLRSADLATANNRHMAREMVLNLGIERGRVQHIVLGVSREFMEPSEASVNIAPRPGHRPALLSTRSLDVPLYNVESVLRAFALARKRIAEARLVVAGEGRLRRSLESLARDLQLGDSVSFIGQLSQEELRQRLAAADVFVSVPSSDATSVALLQAMAVGAFPIVADIPSQRELIEDGVQGLRVPPAGHEALAAGIERALRDGALRRRAAERNRVLVEEYGLLETNMAKMEAWYYRLAGRMADLDAAQVH